jgi:hypothetical protein
VFFDFAGRELDEELFKWRDAVEDERVRIRLKAYADVDMHNYKVRLEYWAIEFDGEYVGLVIGTDRPWGWATHDRYITDYPKHQALVAYVKAMYITKPECIVGATTKDLELDCRMGHMIDKRFSSNMRPMEQEER